MISLDGLTIGSATVTDIPLEFDSVEVIDIPAEFLYKQPMTDAFTERGISPSSVGSLLYAELLDEAISLDREVDIHGLTTIEGKPITLDMVVDMIRFRDGFLDFGIGDRPWDRDLA